MISKAKVWRILSIFLFSPMLVLLLVGVFRSQDQTENLDQQRSPARNTQTQPVEESSQLTFGQPVSPTLSRSVSSLPPVSPDRLDTIIREVNPRISHHIPDKVDEKSFLNPDPVQIAPNLEPIPQQYTVGTTGTFTTPLLNFMGSGFTGVNPPDTVGAIGKDHYIQMVNSVSGSDFLIFDRSGNLVQPVTALDQLGSGLCADGGGDPLVIYDQLADRWFMSEFHNTTSANIVCHYISQTADPLGSWYAYQFAMPNFPDYPKYGLWPNAYIGSANEGGPNSAAAIYAFDRINMLAGQPAGFIRFAPPRLSGFGFQALTPVDLDGTVPPPLNTPPLYLRHVDDEVHDVSNDSSADFIEIWSLTADFDTPANSSFSQVANIPIDEFDSTMCGVGSFRCVPQPSSSQLLDPVREVIMHRVSYLNHGTHQSIVGNMVTCLLYTSPSPRDS